jgi:drug/metabolite transporter (DMT)-like permease
MLRLPLHLFIDKRMNFSNVGWAHLALFLVNTLYAASHILAKGVMPEFLSPNVFILFRVSGATLLFWLVAYFAGMERIERADWWRLIGCAAFGVAVNQLFFFHGLNASSSINSGIIMAMNPIMVVLLSYLVLNEALNTPKLTGILLGTTGAVLLTLSAGGMGKGDSVLGNVFLMINSASYAVYLVMAKPLMAKYRPLTLITWIFTIGFIFVLLFPPTLLDLKVTDFSIIPGSAWLKILYVIIGVTFLTYLLTMYGLSKLSASVSSSYIYVQPMMVILFAFLLFNLGWSDNYTHTITWEKVLYMTLIFAGVYTTSRGSNPMQKKLESK